MKREKIVKNLDGLLRFYELVKHSDAFTKAMDDENKRNIKVIIPFVISILSGVAGTIITGINLFYLVGMGLGISIISKKIYNDYKKEDEHNRLMSERLIKCLENNEEYNEDKTLDSKKNPDDILRDMDRINPSDYYSDLYKDVKEEYKEDSPKVKMKLISSETLDFEEVRSRLIYEFEVYSNIYNLPYLKIDNYEWNMILTIIYIKLEEKGLEKEFYDIMSNLLQHTYAKSMVYKQEITFSFLMETFEIAMRDEFSKEEINLIKYEILEQLKYRKSNIMNFRKDIKINENEINNHEKKKNKIIDIKKYIKKRNY